MKLKENYQHKIKHKDRSNNYKGINKKVENNKMNRDA